MLASEKQRYGLTILSVLILSISLVAIADAASPMELAKRAAERLAEEKVITEPLLPKSWPASSSVTSPAFLDSAIPLRGIEVDAGAKEAFKSIMQAVTSHERPRVTITFQEESLKFGRRPSVCIDASSKEIFPDPRSPLVGTSSLVVVYNASVSFVSNASDGFTACHLIDDFGANHDRDVPRHFFGLVLENDTKEVIAVGAMHTAFGGVWSPSSTKREEKRRALSSVISKYENRIEVMKDKAQTETRKSKLSAGDTKLSTSMLHSATRRFRSCTDIVSQPLELIQLGENRETLLTRQGDYKPDASILVQATKEDISTLKIEVDATKLLIDPWLDRMCMAVAFEGELMYFGSNLTLSLWLGRQQSGHKSVQVAVIAAWVEDDSESASQDMANALDWEPTQDSIQAFARLGFQWIYAEYNAIADEKDRQHASLEQGFSSVFAGGQLNN